MTEIKYGGRTARPEDGGLTRLDSGWIGVHDGAYERHGPWTLAHLEAVLRLADHQRSREEAGGA